MLHWVYSFDKIYISIFYSMEGFIMNNEQGKTLSIVALVLGIVSVVFAFFTGIWSIIFLAAAVVGIVLASMSKKQGYNGGMRIAALVLCIIGVVFCAIEFIACAVCTCAVNSAADEIESAVGDLSKYL